MCVWLCFTQFCDLGRVKLCLCPETGSSYCGWGSLSASHSYIPFCPHCLAFAVRLAQLTNSSCYRLAKGLERWSLVIQAVTVWHLCTLSVAEVLLHLKKGTQVCVSAAPVHSPLASNSVEGVNLNARLKTGAGDTGGPSTFPPTVASRREVGQTALSNNTFNRRSCLCFSARETELSAELPQAKSTQAVSTAQLMCSDLSRGPLTVYLVSQHKLFWWIVYRVSRAAKLHSPRNTCLFSTRPCAHDNASPKSGLGVSASTCFFACAVVCSLTSATSKMLFLSLRL